MTTQAPDWEGSKESDAMTARVEKGIHRETLRQEVFRDPEPSPSPPTTKTGKKGEFLPQTPDED